MQTSTMDYVIYIFHYVEVIGDVEFFLPFGVAVHEELGSGKYNFFSVRKGSRKRILHLMAGPLRPYPPPLGLNGHIFFFAGNGF